MNINGSINIGKGACCVYQSQRTEVYIHRVNGQRYAVKVSSPDALEAEKTALEHLSHHPRIVGISQTVLCDDGFSSNIPALAFPYKTSRLIPTAKNKVPPLPPELALRVVSDVALALIAVHRFGFVHRDIKPSNLFLSPDNRTQLYDFDVAAQRGSFPPKTGTAGYIPLEVFSSAALDHRSDFYSLGATAFELITKELPLQFQSVIASDSLNRHYHDKLVERIKARIASPTLQQHLLKMVASIPRDRFSNAALLFHATNKVLREIGSEKALLCV